MVLLWSKRCLVVHTVYSHVSLWRLWTCDGVVKYTEGDGGSRPGEQPCSTLHCGPLWEEDSSQAPVCTLGGGGIITHKVPLTSSFGPRFYNPIVHYHAAAGWEGAEWLEGAWEKRNRKRQGSIRKAGRRETHWFNDNDCYWYYSILL